MNYIGFLPWNNKRDDLVRISRKNMSVALHLKGRVGTTFSLIFQTL